jgi:hypothetical protein
MNVLPFIYCHGCPSSCRPLAHFKVDSRPGAGAEITQCILLKLYREYTHSAFCVWEKQRVPGLAALMVGDGPTDLLKEMLEVHKQVPGLGYKKVAICVLSLLPVIRLPSVTDRCSLLVQFPGESRHRDTGIIVTAMSLLYFCEP